jgi:hypothetical protein
MMRSKVFKFKIWHSFELWRLENDNYVHDFEEDPESMSIRVDDKPLWDGNSWGHIKIFKALDHTKLFLEEIGTLGRMTCSLFSSKRFPASPYILTKFAAIYLSTP